MKGIFFFWWFGTLIAFIILWWQKRKEQIAGGNDYKNYPPYQQVSKTKRILGALCIISFLLGVVTPHSPHKNEATEITAEKQAQEIKATEEKKKRDEKISLLDGEYKELFEEKYRTYIADGMDEISAKDKSLAHVTAKQNEDKKIQKENKENTENVKYITNNGKIDLNISKNDFDDKFLRLLGKELNKKTGAVVLQNLDVITDKKGRKQYKYGSVDSGVLEFHEIVDENDKIIAIQVVVLDLRTISNDLYKKYIDCAIEAARPDLNWLIRKKILYELSIGAEGTHKCTDNGIVYVNIYGNPSGHSVGMSKAMFMMCNENLKEYSPK